MLKINTNRFLLAGLLVLAFVIQPVFADDTDKMEEILRIINDSGRFDHHMTYFDENVEREKLFQTYKEADPNQILVQKGDKLSADIFTPPDQVIQYLEKADSLKNESRHNEALDLLAEAALLTPDYSAPKRERGRILLELQQHDKALQELDEALQINPVDFQAHKIKGDCHRQKGELQKAKDSYINAVICNRNYLSAWERLAQLGDEMGFIVNDLPFVPLYSIDEVKEGLIRIYFDMDTRYRWLAYSFTKAVWRYDENFFKKQTGLSQYEYTLQEEMECIKQMIWYYKAAKKWSYADKDPLMERLILIQDQLFMREFVYFQILSRANPQILITLDQKYIEDLKEYIEEFVLISKQKY